MAFSPSKLVFEYSDINQRAELTYTVDSSTDTVNKWNVVKQSSIDTGYAVTITSTSTTQCTLYIEAYHNNGTIDTHHSFYLQMYIDGKSTVVRKLFSFTIKANPEKHISPIWKDNIFELTYTPNWAFNYTIETDEDGVIYRGSSIAKPDTGKIEINVNRICYPYLNSGLKTNDFAGRKFYSMSNRTNPNYSKTFYLYDSSHILKAKYNFYNSYSYKDVPFPVLSEPIRATYTKRAGNYTRVSGEMDKRQIMICSFYKPFYGKGYGILRENNGESIQTVYEFNFESGATSTNYIVTNNNINAINYTILGINSDGDYSTNYDISYRVIDTCYDYCLYYQNAFGGYDSLLIDANVKKTDEIKSQYIKKEYNNTRLADFEKFKYHNDITTKYTCYTGWFNDDEQSRLHHLLESTEVYLHNLNTDDIIPVIMTNNKCEYKTFTNNGRKKWYNTLEFEESRQKVRRG